MKKILLLGLISIHANAADLIFKHGFENTALVGGMVTGLVSTGLELKLSFNGTSQVQTIIENGTFIFNLDVPVGANWSVIIETQPSNPNLQICTITNASGTMAATGEDNIHVSCSDTPNNWDVMKWDEGSWN